MGSMSLVHWMIILVVVLLLFGAGRLSNVMGEFAKGIKAFRAGMRDEDQPTPPPQQNPLYHAPVPPPVEHQTVPPSSQATPQPATQPINQVRADS